MPSRLQSTATLVLAASTLPLHAQTIFCSNAPSLAPNTTIVTASGIRFTPVVANLTGPRGIAIDSANTLLVVEPSVGISAHTTDEDGCVTASKVVVDNEDLTHGIDVFENKLYASTSDAVYSWDYNVGTQAVSNMQTVISGMYNNATKSRTVLVSRKSPSHLVVSVGSSEEIDFPSNFPDTQRASIKVFDLTAVPTGGFNYTTAGQLMARGVRNVVALAEDHSGTLHGIDNAMDDAYRQVNDTRVDVQDNNPAENVFNVGDPTSPTSLNGGYPTCFVVWEPDDFTDKQFQPGDWFVQAPNTTFNDASCDAIAKKPEAIIVSHSAPLDAKFGVGDDTNLYVGMHGRWESDTRQGYKIVAISGTYSTSGAWSPSAPLTDNWSWTDVIGNADASQCPEDDGTPVGEPPVTAPTSNCFHPVGLVWNADGTNLYVTSDTSGEVYLVKKG